MRNTKVFLNNEAVFNKIIEASALKKEDVVLEIGSGDGRLTKRISPFVSKVYAVEMDINLLDQSKMLLRDLKNIEYVNEDALKYKFPNDVNKIISNLPYAISSPITEKIILFLNKKKDSLAVLMYQKEFGERMVSIPGVRDYSMLSVFAQYASNPSFVSQVSKSSFRPKPAVDSVIIKLEPKKIEIDRSFLSFAKLLFQHKKKNLYSALMDSRASLNVKDKDDFRSKVSGLNESTLRTKVFFFEVDELLFIYNEVKKLRIWPKEK